MVVRRFRVGVLALPLLLVWLHACGNTDREPRNEPFDVAGSGGTFPNGGGAGTPAAAGVGLQPWTCFEAGSLVATPNGSVPIEELTMGDAVLAFDERAGTAVPRRVQATFAHEVETSGRLALNDGRVLRVTGEHPIYDAERGTYVRADAFDGDEMLVTLSQSLVPLARGSVASLEPLGPALALAQSAGRGFTSHHPGGRVQVFNISVEELESYFVEGVLVHNKTPPLMCDPLPTPWGALECSPQAECLRPSTAPAAGGAGGEGGGADTAGAPAEGGGDSGAGGAVSEQVALSPAASAPLCPGQPSGLLIAVDYAMPETPGATAGFGVFLGQVGQLCGGTHRGDVLLQDEAPPAPGSVTTQCMQLAWPLNTPADSLSVYSLDPSARVGNLRAVSSCDCARGLRIQTTCGVQGNSACHQVPPLL